MSFLSTTYLRSASLSIMLMVAVIAAGNTSVLAQNLSDQTGDSTGALALVANYVAAFNNHNADALTSLFAEKADFVDPRGEWSEGRAMIAERIGRAFSGYFRNVRMTEDTSTIKFISPDIAVIHYQWTISGQINPDGSIGEPFHGITIFVGKREDGQWLIESGQVTYLGPPPVMARTPVTK